MCIPHSNRDVQPTKVFVFFRFVYYLSNDIFLLPDTRDISSYPEILMDQNGEPLEGVFEGESQEETPDESSLKVQE